MFNPADLITRGQSFQQPPMTTNHIEVSTKISPEEKKKRKIEINTSKPASLVGRPIVKIKKREPKEALELHKEHEEVEKKKKEEPKKEEPVKTEEGQKAKPGRKPKVDLVAKIEEMNKTISELRKDKAKEDEKDAMKIKNLEEESKPVLGRKGRFAKGSQEAKDYMAAMRAKKSKK